MMIGTIVLDQANLLLPLNDPPQNPGLNLSFKEQECFSLLQSCKNMEEFKQAHACSLKFGLFWDSFVASKLLSTCALSCWGSMDYACSMFEQIPEPNTFLFNTMVRGHVKDRNWNKALFFYQLMLEIGVEPDNFTYPIVIKACSRLLEIKFGMQCHGHVFKFAFQDDIFVQNSLINMYGKCGEIEPAWAVFQKMDQRNVASWSAIITAHASLSLWHECLMLLGDMSKEGSWRPEESILVSVLSACSHLGALDLGKSVHGYLLRNISELNVIVETCLIDMYLKCGCLEKGLCLFGKMDNKNLLSYSAMISGLAMHGHGREALKLFSEMLKEGFVPDDVIFLGALSACSHAGLVNEGHEYFKRMIEEHGIEPTVKHYCCLVDLMGRAGKLNEALELIKSMPMRPNDVIWRSLLSACRIHENFEIGEIAANNLIRLNTYNPGDYVVLSNMYARAQKWDSVARVRKEMVLRGLMQTPGFSLVEVKKCVFKFVSQDMSHPQSDTVYEMIHQMEWQLRFEGYSPDTSQVLLDVDEEEKRERLKYHSQKLATAFALIHTPQGYHIRIATNLRISSDCHTYTKFILVIC